jgi:hypothetical protein
VLITSLAFIAPNTRVVVALAASTASVLGFDSGHCYILAARRCVRRHWLVF